MVQALQPAFLNTFTLTEQRGPDVKFAAASERRFSTVEGRDRIQNTMIASSAVGTGDRYHLRAFLRQMCDETTLICVYGIEKINWRIEQVNGSF